MGKDAANKSKAIAGQAANNFGSLATNLSAQSAPALKQSQDYYSAILKGGPEAYSAISPSVDFTKQQFKNSRDSLMASAPAGGAVPANLTSLAQGQAQTISNLYQSNINNALQGLVGLGTSETQGALGATQGQTSVSGQLAQLAAQQLGAWTSGIGSLGGGLGTLFGSILKPPVPAPVCWIAEALYGEDDPRVVIIRSYLVGPFSRHAYGRFIVGMYRRFGVKVAQMVRRSTIVRATMRPIFDSVLRSAIRQMEG